MRKVRKFGMRSWLVEELRSHAKSKTDIEAIKRMNLSGCEQKETTGMI